MNKLELKEYYEQQFLQRYEKLNEKQKEAVDTIEGPILVVAGPGTGKTELLSIRTANILNKMDTLASNILILTFTESGAKNLRNRIVDLIGDMGHKVGIYTFHAFASDMMGKFSEFFFDGASFRPATDIERFGIMQEVMKDMDYDNILSKQHINKYIYQSDIFNIITGLKKNNFTPEEFKNLIVENEKILSFLQEKLSENIHSLFDGERKFDLVFTKYKDLLEKLAELAKTDDKILQKNIRIFHDSLEIIFKNIVDKNGKILKKTSPFTKWRKNFFEQIIDEKREKKSIFKGLNPKDIQKWLAVAEAYEKYEQKMYESGLFDFDDMILLVSRELKKNLYFRNILQEQYQFIMVDEFQDTSQTQFELVKNLMENSVNEERPNILAVGDDDQAIFKFQGAELDNVHKFIESFKNPIFITLDKNYRSCQNILECAKIAIEKIEENRLTKVYDQINKNLQASHPERLKNEGKIEVKSFDNQILEEEFVAGEIEKLLKDGVNANEIAVITRKHADLISMAEILNAHKIPYSYEKKENVLQKPHILQIINILLFVANGLENPREDLLPKILSYDFFNLDRIEIWKIGRKVQKGRELINENGSKIYEKISWLDAMLESENIKIRQVGEFLVELCVDAQSMPLAHLIDKIVGTSEYEKIEEHDDLDEVETKNIQTKSGFVSPFRDFYFGGKILTKDSTKYIDFLFSLRTFIGGIREYKIGKVLYAKDIEQFVKIYEENSELKLNLVSPFATSESAVVLQTAHKAKGLEYEYVFVINSDKDKWEKTKNGSNIKSPFNLKLLPETDDKDDKIRLYYVAMTRAKHTLYITYNDEPFHAITDVSVFYKKKNEEKKYPIGQEIYNKVMLAKGIVPIPELVENEKIFLNRLLENYQMSVTHLINYINFSKIGPSKFIEQNILHFPQAMSSSSVYGTAIHEAMQLYYQKLNNTGKYPEFDQVFEFFKNALNRGRLQESEFEKRLKQGKKVLQVYLADLQKRNEKGMTKVEVNFKNENVTLHGASLSGKIDKMLIENHKNIILTDLKTGTSFNSWTDNKNSTYNQIKLHFFKYQLAFYNILINNSTTFDKYEVASSNIEFVEPDEFGKINILTLEFDPELIKRVEKLTAIVFRKIMNLEFPDTNKYLWNEQKGKLKEKDDATLKDILKFEDDLLAEWDEKFGEAKI